MILQEHWQSVWIASSRRRIIRWRLGRWLLLFVVAVFTAHVVLMQHAHQQPIKLDMLLLDQFQEGSLCWTHTCFLLFNQVHTVGLYRLNFFFNLYRFFTLLHNIVPNLRQTLFEVNLMAFKFVFMFTMQLVYQTFHFLKLGWNITKEIVHSFIKRPYPEHSTLKSRYLVLLNQFQLHLHIFLFRFCFYAKIIIKV